MARTKTLNPKDKKFTAHDLKMGQVIEIEGKNYVVLVIGAMWAKGPFKLRSGDQIVMPDMYHAIIAPHNDPSTNFNLVLHPYDAEWNKEEDVVEVWDKFDLSEEQRQRILATPINVTEYGGRTYLQNLLFSVHSHPPEGLGIIYSEVDLERVCDAMIKKISGDLEQSTTSDTRLVFTGALRVFEQMKAFFSHKA